MTTAGRPSIASVTLMVLMLAWTCAAAGVPAGDSGMDAAVQPNDRVSIERLTPLRKGGQGYRLVYRVGVPAGVYWKFKTDFDNTFLVENKFISEHRLVSRNGSIVVTENRYAHGPDVYYRWQTTVFPDLYTLDFHLFNADECHHDNHFGTITVKPHMGGTLVTQVVYFDFWGASLWAIYPWHGGMKDFLTYTARWEQATALRLKDRYHD
jgi:hypothetical protein